MALTKKISTFALLLLTLFTFTNTTSKASENEEIEKDEITFNFEINGEHGKHDLSIADFNYMRDNSKNYLAFEVVMNDFDEATSVDFEVVGFDFFDSGVFSLTMFIKKGDEPINYVWFNPMAFADEEARSMININGRVFVKLFFEKQVEKRINFLSDAYKEYFTYEINETSDDKMYEFDLIFNVSDLLYTPDLEYIYLNNFYSFFDYNAALNYYPQEATFNTVILYKDGMKVTLSSLITSLEEQKIEYLPINFVIDNPANIDKIVFKMYLPKENYFSYFYHNNNFELYLANNYLDTLINNEFAAIYTNLTPSDVRHSVTIDGNTEYLKEGTILEPIIKQNKKFVGYYLDEDFITKLPDNTVNQALVLFAKYEGI